MKVLKVIADDLEFTKRVKDHRTLKNPMALISIFFEDKKETNTLNLYTRVGFLFDGASVPKILRRIVPSWYPDMKKNIPAFVHDILFAVGGALSEKSIMCFKKANQLYKALLKYFDCLNGILRRWSFKAVNSFVGRRHYKDTNRFDKHNIPKISWNWGII